ncbi:MAG: hypothetical protein LBS74_01670, partial [Oscillospiraceae bacterium]|nr:hypothetical protein [Oscillospiraceae bacterium]
MKKLLICVLCVALLLSFSGCASKEKAENYDSEITAFSYHFGSFNEGYWRYDIEPISGVSTLTATGSNGVDLDIEKPVTAAQFTALNKIITDNQIYKWNKFNKSNH